MSRNNVLQGQDPNLEKRKEELVSKIKADDAKEALFVRLQANTRMRKLRFVYEEKFLKRIEDKQKAGELLKEWELSWVRQIEARLTDPKKHFGLKDPERLDRLERFKKILAKDEEYTEQFRTAATTGARGFLARRKLDEKLLNKFESEFDNPSRVFSDVELRLVDKAIKRLKKSTDFEEIRARPVAKPANIIEPSVVGRAKKDLERYEDLLKKHNERHKAVTTIAARFRGNQVRKTLDAAAAAAAAEAAARAAAAAANPVVDPAAVAAAEAAARAAAAATYPRYIDRIQRERELRKPIADKAYTYNETDKKFNETTDLALQGRWINGIEGKRKAALDDNGNPIMRNQEHLGFDRSHAYNTDSIQLHQSGFMVAQYDELIDLQKDIDAVRIRRRSLKSGEIKVSFASYKSKNKKTLIEEENYMMLIETSKGLTSVFVGNDGAMQRKISEAEASFNGDKEAMLSEALVACAAIPDDKKQEAAEKMVRQAIRERVMRTMAQEIQEGQTQSAALHKFDQGDLEKIYGDKAKLNTLDKIAVKSTGPGSIFTDPRLTNPERLARQIKGTLGRVPDPVSNYIEHGGVAISKNRNGAKVTFNYAGKDDDKTAGRDIHDEMWINIPETSFYIKCRVALEAGEYPNFENGDYVGMKYRKAGETWIEPNTIYYNNGADYERLCVHTDHLKINPKNTLKKHPMANYQGGAKGFKAIQDAYDRFPVEVVAHVGDVRSVAIKLKGQPIVSTLLDPVAYKDKNAEEVVITKKLPDVNEINNINIADGKPDNKPWQAQQAYFKCPRLDLSVNLKKGISADEASKINDTQKADEAFKIIEGKIGQVFIEFDCSKFAQENPRAINAGDYRGGKDPYVLKASGGYEKVERRAIVDALRSGFTDAQGVVCGALSQEDAEKYADRYLERFAEVKVKGLKVDNQFTKEEERLLYRASAYGEGENNLKTTNMIAEYKTRKDALDAKIGAAGKYTAEEKKELYKDVLFNIDAVDARGRTALHIAAADNNKELVDALIGAGADPTIRDNKGKTAMQLAAKGGFRNAGDPDDNVVSNLERAEIAFNKDTVKVLTARFEALDIELNGPYKVDAAGNREKDAKGNPAREHQDPSVSKKGLRYELKSYAESRNPDLDTLRTKNTEVKETVKELEAVQKQLAKAEKRKPSTTLKPISSSKTAAPEAVNTTIMV